MEMKCVCQQCSTASDALILGWFVVRGVVVHDAVDVQLCGHGRRQLGIVERIVRMERKSLFDDTGGKAEYTQQCAVSAEKLACNTTFRHLCCES